MDVEKIFLITDHDGYSPQISRLLSMMNYARFTTLNTVKGLSSEQLDYLHDSACNTIGGLLSHIAAVEFEYQIWTFEKRDLNEEELIQWKPALELGDLGRQNIKGQNLEYYINLLDKVRQKTLEEFKKRNDDWLNEETSFLGNKQANNYFKWFHVFEDEINHRGQMRWLKNRLPKE
jgi:uncharacterized damage-inducible protein DinB